LPLSYTLDFSLIKIAPLRNTKIMNAGSRKREMSRLPLGSRNLPKGAPPAYLYIRERE